AIPGATSLRSVDVSGGVATIDLDSDFVSGGGSFSMRSRLAQVIYTATRVEGVTSVRILLDGTPTTVFGGEGVTIASPAGRSGFDDLLPAIFVETPVFGGFAPNPAIVEGSANTFEGTVRVVLTDAEGLILFDGFTTAACGSGCRGDFRLVIPYSVDRPQIGSLIVFEESPADGSQINVREYAVGLAP
nr:hypothetical protein [Actinomycetota bacterium]